MDVKNDSRFSDEAQSALSGSNRLARGGEILDSHFMPTATTRIVASPPDESHYTARLYCPNKDCDARSSSVSMTYPFGEPSELRNDFVCPSCGERCGISGYEFISDDAIIAANMVTKIGPEAIERVYLEKVAAEKHDSHPAGLQRLRKRVSSLGFMDESIVIEPVVSITGNWKGFPSWVLDALLPDFKNNANARPVSRKEAMVSEASRILGERVCMDHWGYDKGTGDLVSEPYCDGIDILEAVIADAKDLARKLGCHLLFEPASVHFNGACARLTFRRK